MRPAQHFNRRAGAGRSEGSCLNIVVNGAKNDMNEILDSSFSSQLSVDSMMSMSVDDYEFSTWRRDASSEL